jgi:N-acetylmuramoyl-L-alanine amidase
MVDVVIDRIYHRGEVVASIPEEDTVVGQDSPPVRRTGCLLRQLQVAVLLMTLFVVALVLFQSNGSEGGPFSPGRLPTLLSTAHPQGTGPAAEASRTPMPTITPGGEPIVPRRVGILAGHHGPEGDPGAVCPDGLREVDVNLEVALRVVAALQARGHHVDLLGEYDERLDGYQADAFLSIHSDACDIADATGFKVARAADSAIPSIEDDLVACLYSQYERVTGLPRHDASITPDMHGYHAFLQIAPLTPGAIIEIGFLSGDREMLVQRPGLASQGIVSGLVCFLER